MKWKVDETEYREYIYRINLVKRRCLFLGSVGIILFTQFRKWNNKNTTPSEVFENTVEFLSSFRKRTILSVARVPIISSFLSAKILKSQNVVPLLPDFRDVGYPAGLPTLVLDVEGVLAKLDYDPSTGWLLKKRPFADQMIKELMYYYEILIWTGHKFPLGIEMVNAWGLPVIGTLHKENWDIVGGRPFKNLDRLGRSLVRTIVVDTDPSTVAMHKENCIKIGKYSGDESDTELKTLAPLLKHLAMKPNDLRPVLEEYAPDHMTKFRNQHDNKMRKVKFLRTLASYIMH